MKQMKEMKKKVLMVSAGLFMTGLILPVIHHETPIQAQAASKNAGNAVIIPPNEKTPTPPKTSVKKNVLLIYPSLYELKPNKGSVQNLKRYEMNPKTGKLSLYRPKNQAIAGDFIYGTINNLYLTTTYYFDMKSGKVSYKQLFIEKKDVTLKNSYVEYRKVYKAKEKATLRKGTVAVYTKVKGGFVVSDSISLKKDTKITVVSQGKNATMVKIKPDKSIKKYSGKEIYVLYGSLK